MGLLVTIDNGGTLTDVCAFDGQSVYYTKSLTTPHDLTECLMDGLSKLSREILGQDEEDLAALLPMIDYLRYSTTQGTNAIVQRQGPRLGILTDDVQTIASLPQRDGGLFQSAIGGRIRAVDWSASRRDAIAPTVTDLVAEGTNRIVILMTGDRAAEREVELKALLYDLFPRHLLGAVPLLFSTELVPRGSFERRAWTAIFNAFLHPSMESFLHNAERKLRSYRLPNPMLIFRNDGNSTRVARTVAINTYSSGPRGGVEGAAVLARHYGIDHAISIDVGGTTTDIARFDHGRIEEDDQGSIEDLPVAIPMARVASLGVGGSSVITAAGGAIGIGPESVGSLPGPACFGRGGTALTITDVYVASGLLDPATYFGGRLLLDKDRAVAALRQHVAGPLGLDMASAIARIIAAYDTRIAAALPLGEGDEAALLAFGGAGPINACGIAGRAGIGRVLIPRQAAVFSAFGIGFSDVCHNHVTPARPENVEAARAQLHDRARRGMASEGFDFTDCVVEDYSLAQPDGEALLGVKVTQAIAKPALAPAADMPRRDAVSSGTRDVSGHVPVFRLETLKPGDTAAGPCLIEEQFFTARVPAGWQFSITAAGDVMVIFEGAVS